MVQSTLLTSITPTSMQQVTKNLFSENFWGEKNNGFEVLSQNLKHSLTSVKDLETFLRESANCEDSNVKFLNKLITQISRFSPNGSFNPLWAPLKELNEKYSAKHSEQLQHIHDLIKEIQRYHEDLGKKIKKIRESELPTQTCVQNFQEIHTNLNKTKEQYHNLCIEFDKQKRQLDPQQLAQYQQQISSTNLLALSNNSGLNSAQINPINPNQVHVNDHEGLNNKRNEPFTLTVIGGLPESAQITKKRINKSMFKSFTNFLRDHTGSGSDGHHGQTSQSMDQGVSSLSLRENPTSGNIGHNRIGVKANNSLLVEPHNTGIDIFQSSFSSSFSANKTLNSPYSLLSLPPRTQCLLTAQPDFDKLPFFEKTTYSSRLRDVQLYLSTPFSLILPNKCGICGQNSKNSLFGDLREYCSNASTPCDFNLIDLDSIISDTRSNLEPSLKQKYIRRMLGNFVLRDSLNIGFLNNRRQTTTGLFVFCVILSDNENIANPSVEDLLCPEVIEKTHLNTILNNNFNNKEVCDLIKKWYINDIDNVNNFRLNTEILLIKNDCNDELEKLLHVLQIGLEGLSTQTEDLTSKYLRTIQQEEIELAVQHLEPSAIIWLQLSSRNEETRPASPSAATILSLLQSHVLAHNYQECTISEQSDQKNASISLIGSSFNKSSDSPSKICNTIYEFLLQSITSLINTYISELAKKQVNELALRIDKQLANEIFSHFQLYLQLSSPHTSLITPTSKTHKFDTLINSYLAEIDNTKEYPLVLYRYENEASCVPRTIPPLSWNQLISLYMSRILSAPHKSPSPTARSSIVIYRFCAHTLVSSDVTTIIQSIAHHICYLLEIHESWAFNSPSKIVENLVRALEKRKTMNLTSANKNVLIEYQQQELIIFLEGTERLIKSTEDQEILLNLIDKLYKADGPFSFKIVLTYTLMSDEHDEHIGPLDKIYPGCSKLLNEPGNNSNNVNHNQDQKSTLTYENILINARQMLTELLKINSVSDTLSEQLSDNLLKNLGQSRYGLKQSEIGDLLVQNDFMPPISKDITSNQSALVLNTWFALKYLSTLIPGLLETMHDHDQILYRLKKPNNILKNQDLKVTKLVNKYFQTNSNCGLRGFLEMPMLEQNDPKFILDSYILNGKWLIDKIECTQNILYFMQDTEGLKRLFSKNKSNKNGSGSSVEFTRFEKVFYQMMYALHQEIQQLPSQLELYNEEKDISRGKSLVANTRRGSNCQLIGLNGKESLCNDESSESIIFNNLEKSLQTNCTRVLFISERLICGLSEYQKLIRIWEVNEDGKMNLIRTIKLNKPPKDIRLLNANTAAILLERNLHLFDLNICSHTLDMNSTMSAQVPFFEVHDSNHVVLLARNRLSVMLMRVGSSISDTDNKNSENMNNENMDSNENGNTVESCYKDGKVDGMFLFKAGEDRYLNSLMVSGNGQIMVCGDEVQKPFPLLVWNLNQRKLVYDLRQAKHEFITTIQSIGSTGKFMVCACKEEGEFKNCLVVYDLSTGQMSKKLKAKVNYTSVEISEEFNVIIACLENAQIIVYDLSSGSEKNIIQSNHYPANQIKLLSSSRGGNYILTYDTKGTDWTIRLWHLEIENKLLSAFTCTSRIISCSFNTGPFFFGSHGNANKGKNTKGNSTDEILIAVSLYGTEQLLLLRLDENNSLNSNTNGNKTVLTPAPQMLKYDSNLNGIVKEVII